MTSRTVHNGRKYAVLPDGRRGYGTGRPARAGGHPESERRALGDERGLGPALPREPGSLINGDGPAQRGGPRLRRSLRPAAQTAAAYERRVRRLADELGCRYVSERLYADAAEADVVACVGKLGADPARPVGTAVSSWL
ncbi:MAG: hypothetical protein ACYCVZ_11165 [Streptosporangiaceae bacterium]